MVVFKAYDVRGLYPEQVNENLAQRLSQALVIFLGKKPSELRIAIGRDMRDSSVPLSQAASSGLQRAGATAIDIGMVTTPMLYHVVADGGLDAGIMVTASHNPSQYNGFKLCREKAIPIGEASGLKQLEALCDGPEPTPAAQPGGQEAYQPLPSYIEHLVRLAGPLAHRPSSEPAMRVGFDCGNGVVGAVIAQVLEALPGIEPHALYWEPDGSFPNHEANPLVTDNLRDLSKMVRDLNLDVGVAFDGDGDRMALVDQKGVPVPADRVTALLACDALQQSPGAAIVYDLRSSRVVAEEVLAAGGRPVKERVGHAFIKATMRREDAVLGGELSGHFYFRDHHYCDSGLVATVSSLALIKQRAEPLSEIRRPLERYFQSGECNFTVRNPDLALEQLANAYSAGTLTEIDGISVDYNDWWFNARKSNTEPVLRLNVEATNKQLLQQSLSDLETLLARIG